MDFATVLRLLHIASAIFWVGTAFFMLLFLEPVVQRAGEVGNQIMDALASRTRFPLAIALSAITTVLTGLVMYEQAYGFDPATMLSSKLPLSLGATSGILAALTGFYFQGRSIRALVALGATIARQGSPPNPEQLARMQLHRQRVALGTRISTALMVLAVIGMVV